MGDICGWYGADFRAKSREIISSMVSGCSTNSPPESTFGDTGALFTCKGLYAVSLGEKHGIKAAIVGHPQWKDSKLAAIAAESSISNSLIEAYRALGLEFLKQLHGPFALAISDGNSALIAIDRIGIHSLSYAYDDNVFVFATSTASVVNHPAVNRIIDPQAIFNYFYFHDIPSPGTVYDGVEKLLPAQYVLWRSGRIEKGFYWRLHYNDRDVLSFEREKQQLHKLLRSAVKKVPNNGPTATFLSGGTDSSTVTGVFAETTPGPVNAYSIGFGAEEFDEMKYARLAAKHFGANIQEYYLEPDDILEAIPIITENYDEPFGNDSAVPTYFCAKKAAENGVKIMLAGDGGDEIFGGNARYAKQMVFEHYTKVPEFIRNRLIEPFILGFPAGDTILPVRKLRSYIRQANIPMPNRMESYNFIHRQPLEEMFVTSFLSLVNPEVPEHLLQDAYFRADSTHPINRMLHLDIKFTLADNDLRKVSRMCEAAGVQVRYPILDEAIVEFSASLPPNFKVKGQKLRWFFKESLKDFLPKEIISKSKHGFGLPFGYWSLSHPPLKALVDKSLTNFESRGYLKPEYIHNLRRQHAKEHPIYFGKMIWVILMLEQWLGTHT